jgi:signal transduction histidine kinase
MSLLMDDGTYRRHHAGVRAAAGRDQAIEGANLELVGRHRDGQPITALVSLSELSSQGERLILGAVRDVTEMVELRSQLQRSVVAKDEFIATVSHELRTPLTAVVAFSEMIRAQPDMDPAERAEFIDLVASQARDVSYLIDDLLVAARLDSDSVAIALKPTNLRAEVIEAVIAWTGERSLEVDHVALNRTVMTDPRRLRQVLRNLVSNAVKYGGDEIAITAVDAGDGMCHVLVRDNGPGVPPGRERLVFEPYEHSYDVEGQPLSIGLGLHVSRRLAEAMGGSLEYRRHHGLTEFALVVPEEITAEVR